MALICMTGFAIYLVSDLVSYASNQDYKAASVGLDQKGPENSIPSGASDKENVSKINSSLQSGQVAKASAITVKSSSSSSSGSKHHSSSSSKSSSSNSAKASINTSNLTNVSATALMSANSTETAAAQANVTANASAGSQGAGFAAPTVLESIPLAVISNLANPSGKSVATEPESTIVFKTETKANGGSVSDSIDKAKSSRTETKNIKFKTADAKSLATKESSPAATSPSSKAAAAREKMKAKKNSIEQAMKKKAAMMRSRAR